MNNIPQYDHDKIQPIPWISQIGKLMKSKSLSYYLEYHFNGINCSKHISVEDKQE